MKALALAIFCLGALLMAADASACFDCCQPPPYTVLSCCSVICGYTGCDATSSGGFGSVCQPSGDVCSQNDTWCSSHGGDREPLWAQCAPPPLSDRWQLITVKVMRAARTTQRS